MADRYLLPECKFCGLRHASAVSCEGARDMLEVLSTFRSQFPSVISIPHGSPYGRGKSKLAMIFEQEAKEDNQFLVDMNIWPVRFDAVGRIIVDDYQSGQSKSS